MIGSWFFCFYSLFSPVNWNLPVCQNMFFIICLKVLLHCSFSVYPYLVNINNSTNYDCCRPWAMHQCHLLHLLRPMPSKEICQNQRDQMKLQKSVVEMGTKLALQVVGCPRNSELLLSCWYWKFILPEEWCVVCYAYIPIAQCLLQFWL